MLSSQQYEVLQALSTPLLADARVRLGLLESHLDPGIRPVVPFTRMMGTAVTVRLEMATDESSGDLSLLRDTYASQAPGSFSIIVIQVPEQLHRYGIVGEGAATLDPVELQLLRLKPSGRGRLHYLALRPPPDLLATLPEALERLSRAHAFAVRIDCALVPFLGGIDVERLRTFGVIAGLEAELGRPVVSSNQAFAWHLHRLAGVQDVIPGLGTLFEHVLPA